MTQPNLVEEAAAFFIRVYDAGVKAERERCAKICDDFARSHRTTRKGEGAELCACIIRNLNSEAK